MIEPGTWVRFVVNQNRNSSLNVNNGGTLISCGTPSDFIIYTSAEWPPAYDNYDYQCAVYIDETASPATRIEYNTIHFALRGIVINNNRLDTPVQNNYLADNGYGIVEYGTKHTDIINNVLYVNFYGGRGIDVYMESQVGIADANSRILIENNTCDGSLDDICHGNYGIVVHGATDSNNNPDCNNAGQVMIADNIVANACYEGIYLVDGAMWAGVYNTGYYANAANNNLSPEQPEENPVQAANCPFVCCDYWVTCGWHWLNQGSPFVDAGSQYIEQTSRIGMTTDINGIPDSGMVDLGMHFPSGYVPGDYPYMNFAFSNAGEGLAVGDINRDAVTDGLDLELLVWDWLNPSPNDANDLNDDGKVNFKDYAILAQTWYQIIGHPDIRPMVSGNPSNLSGNVDVNVTNFGAGTMQAFVLMDGQFLGEILDLYDEGGIGLDTRVYNNGEHMFKVVTVDYNLDVTVSPVLTVNFTNDLYCISGADSFEEGRDYQLAVMYSDVNNLRVKLVDWDGTEAYTSPTTTGYVNATIPANEFTDQIYDIKVEKQAASWEGILTQGVGRKYKPGTYEFAIFLPSTKRKPKVPGEYRKQTVAEIEHICKDIKHMPYVILRGGECNWDNFKKTLQLTSVKYVYLATHGNYYYGSWLDGIQRTNFDLTGCKVLSKREHPDLPPDGGSVHYMSYLGLGEKMKIVHIDACYQVAYEDMAQVWLGAYDPLEHPLGRVFISWAGWTAFDHASWENHSTNIWLSLGERGDNFHDSWEWALDQEHNPIYHELIRGSRGYRGDSDNMTSFP